MMKIVDHGSWSRYTPEVRPEHLPANVLFCKNEDGVDWYDYLRDDQFAPSSIKLTVLEGVVRAATRDASMLFPQNCKVLEIVGDQVVDPQAKYGDMIYDAKASGFAPQPPLSALPAAPDVATLLDTIQKLTARIDALERQR
jgi:hypothetical protein